MPKTKPKPKPTKKAKPKRLKRISGPPIPPPAPPAVAYYKVLVDGKSCSGGDFSWSLPTDGKPGQWHRDARLADGAAPSLCKSGFHLTQDPVVWYKPGCRVYLTEYRGSVVGPEKTGDDHTKISVSECRLIRELNATELAVLGIYTEGEHTARAGHSVACGSSNVTALDSSNVTAWGSSNVTARDSSNVTARDSSNVTAWDSSNVTAENRSTILKRSRRAAISLLGFAVEVDWTTERAEFRRADPPQPVSEKSS